MAQKAATPQYEETLRKNNPVPKRAAEQPHEARKGRVAKARRKMHGSSVDTTGDRWVNTANSEQTQTDGALGDVGGEKNVY